jgi:hypothetical protein
LAPHPAGDFKRYEMQSGTPWLRGLIMLAILGLCGAVAAEEVKVSERALQHFKAGVAYLNDPEGARYEDAYREFQAVLAESRTTKTVYNAGLCAFHLERDQEAVGLWTEFLATAGSDIDPRVRVQVERDLAVLKRGLVTVNLTVSPREATLLDERIPANGRAVLNRYQGADGSFALGIHPGHHRIRAELSGSGAVSEPWEFDGMAGGVLTHEFKFERATATAPAKEQPAPAMSPAPTATSPTTATEQPSAERRTPAGVYVGLAATGALAAGATVVGVLALSNRSEFDRKNRGDQPDRAEDLRRTGLQLNVLTDVLIGAAALAAGGTAYLYFSRRETTGDSLRAGIRVRPVLERDGGWVRVSGSF